MGSRVLGRGGNQRGGGGGSGLQLSFLVLQLGGSLLHLQLQPLDCVNQQICCSPRLVGSYRSLLQISSFCNCLLCQALSGSLHLSQNNRIVNGYKVSQAAASPSSTQVNWLCLMHRTQLLQLFPLPSFVWRCPSASGRNCCYSLFYKIYATTHA